MSMRFCEKCGSRMNVSSKGFACVKCGTVIVAETTESRKVHPSSPEPVYVVEGSSSGSIKVGKVCPRCGNPEAHHWSSTISGDHAGVNRERTLEHFKCAKCQYSWNVSH